ncbi:peptide deformylase [Solwaraspora sp. WMMB335]|uniref:peptide deformylase n=1 Tax=Solwaraspora sp. WMMB335 TaxID=3404118 RepID=UPI003B93BDBA
MTSSPIDRAADTFAAELAQWRVDRAMTKKQLAARMGFDPSYISHVEGRRHRPTEDFARRAEAVLGAGGAIWQRFQEYDDLRASRTVTPARDAAVAEQWQVPGTGLIVEQETAVLSYRDGFYHCAIRRALYNAGTEPVTRYPVRIAVDRYPDDPQRSNRHHHDHPLTFAELDLDAACGGTGHLEPMLWRAKHDRDAAKEVWLLFENSQGRFPLYPGQRTTIEYTYRVGQEKWGQWFQRAVRLPTRRLTVRLDFPTTLDPQVWGVETSLSAEDAPLRTPLRRQDVDGRTALEWSTEVPPLNARYRLEWRFRRGPRDPEDTGTPGCGGAAVATGPVADSGRLRALGIVQRGAAILRQPARPFDLPSDEAIALDTIARLRTVLARLDQLHPFSKGLGLAAPQIGLPWAAAVVRPPDPGLGPVVLLNPRVVAAARETDQQYEGCLSFFDVRGSVPRPLRIDVEHTGLAGGRMITSFDRAMARLVAHEIDHLEGRLYVDRMPPGAALVPVEEYGGSGHPWIYLGLNPVSGHTSPKLS